MTCRLPRNAECSFGPRFVHADVVNGWSDGCGGLVLVFRDEAQWLVAHGTAEGDVLQMRVKFASGSTLDYLAQATRLGDENIGQPVVAIKPIAKVVRTLAPARP